MKPTLHWQLHGDTPVIAPGALHGDLDAAGAGACHVLQLGDAYRMYYWGRGVAGNVILMAERPIDDAGAWQPVGGPLLRPQPDVPWNVGGPSFPFVLPVDESTWLMYFGAWGKPRGDGRLPNTTGLAISSDAGLTWRYHGTEPVLPLDRPWDTNGTGSVWVLRDNGAFRMYYTSIGEYFPRPEGVRTGHGDVIPRIGIGYAVSADGVSWEKPHDGLLIEPRGFGTDPYEYISSKPCILRDGDTWRMWLSTFGHAYRIRNLTSPDGLLWEWQPSPADGDLGIGAPGCFDDHQRSYASVLKIPEGYRLWYTGNGFGSTGMGVAVGTHVQMR